MLVQREESEWLHIKVSECAFAPQGLGATADDTRPTASQAVVAVHRVPVAAAPDEGRVLHPQPHPGVDLGVAGGCLAAAEPEDGCGSDHRPVVGAEAG